MVKVTAMDFILTTTETIDGYSIDRYIAVVTGESIFGINAAKDWVAGIKDFWGGRVGGYEEEIRKARIQAMAQIRDNAVSLGANAIIGIRFDYETLSPRGTGTVIMVTVSGTAVQCSRKV